MKFIQLTDRNRPTGAKDFFINVAYITGMTPHTVGAVVYVDLAHGGTGKGDALLVNETPEQILSKIINAQEV